MRHMISLVHGRIFYFSLTVQWKNFWESKVNKQNVCNVSTKQLTSDLKQPGVIDTVGSLLGGGVTRPTL